ncbi:hypothetical protein FOB22_001244, partial [Saccharomyces cerevisiae]
KFSRNHHQPYLHSNNPLSSNPLSLKRAIFLNQQISGNASTNANNDNINNSTATSMTNQSFLSSSNFDLTLEDRINYIKATPTPVPFPPINLQGLKEIDLQEILKNPQLRHDIYSTRYYNSGQILMAKEGIKKDNWRISIGMMFKMKFMFTLRGLKYSNITGQD